MTDRRPAESPDGDAMSAAWFVQATILTIIALGLIGTLAAFIAYDNSNLFGERDR